MNRLRCSQQIATFSPALLCRQSIVLLSHLGVVNKSFRNIFTDDISQRKGMANRMIDGKQVPTQSDLQSVKRLTSFPLAELKMSGFNHDPLFMNVCKAVEARILHGYKWEGTVPIQKGVHLMGTVWSNVQLKPRDRR